MADLGVPSLVVTSIAASTNTVLRALATGCKKNGISFIVIGDRKSPSDFLLPDCQYFSLEQQEGLDLAYARVCPIGHYARKNIGYLLAIDSGAPIILETDDDNLPRSDFWRPRELRQSVPLVTGGGWVNVYGFFTDAYIWPRGLPLTEIQSSLPALNSLESRPVEAPIQQGLADDNPDVDAIYRLSRPLPVHFEPGRQIALTAGAWSPFNSQNTCWWPQAYPLLYLPALCSFRMTDIWRSFVAQRIAYEYGWGILFASPDVEQARNEHDLIRDFEDEIPGYLSNDRIMQTLFQLTLEPDLDAIGQNLHHCYTALVEEGYFPPEELALLDAWLADLAKSH